MRRWKIASLAWTVLASLVLIVVPTSIEIAATEAVPSDSTPTPAVGHTRHLTLVEAEGWQVLWVLLPPILIPALALTTTRRWLVLSAGALYLLLTLPAAASVGLFYVPAAVALIVAGALGGGRPTDQKSPVGVQEP